MQNEPFCSQTGRHCCLGSSAMEENLTSILQGLGDLGSVFLNDDLFTSWEDPPAQLPQDQHIGSVTLQRHEAISVCKEAKAEGAASKPLSKRSRRPSQGVEEELRSKLGTLKALTCQNQLLQERISMLETVLKVRLAQTQRLQAVQAGFTTDPLLPMGLSIQKLLSMTLQDMASWGKQFLVKIGEDLLLAQAQEPGSSGISQWDSSAVAKMQQTSDCMLFAFFIRPDILLLSGRNVNEMEGSDPESASMAPESHWDSVIQQVNLSQQQLLKGWVLADLHSRWRSRILKERAVLTSQLSQLLSVNKYQGGVETTPLLAAGAEVELLGKLESSIIKERALILLCAEVSYRHILDMSQVTRLSVLSYPYIPDDIALLNAAATAYKAGTSDGVAAT